MPRDRLDETVSDGRQLIYLRVASDQDPYTELLSLRQWLTDEAALTGDVRVDQPPTRSGQMGALADTLVVAVSGGGAVTVLARSLSVWLRQRRADVTIEVQSADGRHVIVTANRVPDAEAIIREVLRDQNPSGQAQDAAP